MAGEGQVTALRLRKNSSKDSESCRTWSCGNVETLLLVLSYRAGKPSTVTPG